MTGLAPFAVLFKVHFWDDFCDRQFARLRDHAGGADLFVIVDETVSGVPNIPCDRVIRLTEAMSEQEGYLRQPYLHVFWQNTDYQLYHFIDQHPQYEYVFICEYDCVVNADIPLIIEAMQRLGLGFVGEPIRVDPATWNWTPMLAPFYGAGATPLGRLIPCAAFSRTFLRAMQQARRLHTEKAKAEDLHTPEGVMPWPNNEAFIGAEIERLAMPNVTLSCFGDTSHYDWSPPYHEAELPSLAGSAFVHPVLDGPRFVRSVVKLGWRLEDLFTPGTDVHTRLAPVDAGAMTRTLLPYFLETKNWAAIGKLRSYAAERCGLAAMSLFNVALGKPATQSSTSRWSRYPTRAADAGGAVNGSITGLFSFHTDWEADPWWMVDLEMDCPIRQIRIYNRLDHIGRSRSLVVSGSRDLNEWSTIYRHEGGPPFGGADGQPLVITPSEPVTLRFLRLQLQEVTSLHLDEVEVFV
jgi:hypothetical protein